MHQTFRLGLQPGPALQERARAARYNALGEWAAETGLAGIVTAHHADDQAETLLMRLVRGAGVRGLAGMRERSPLPGWPNCILIRPLLQWRRSELAAIVASAGLSPMQDPSNADLRFERVRIRTYLAKLPEVDALMLASSASHLAEADAAIEWAAERALRSVERNGAAFLWMPGETPRAIVLRVLERIIAQIGGPAPRGKALSRWHDQLAAGKVATLAGVRGDGSKAQWRFMLAPLRRQASDRGTNGP